ncbi:MAG: KpsF/GutQ family sugar-phosphate isomerase [Planctomycetota bacterium]
MDAISEIRQVIHQEMSALKELVDVVNGDYEKAVQLLYSCRGKVVVSGIGKSGIIARKIASTMASTGTSSIFLHPTEALHGDLGIVSADDVMLVISKSGESAEVNGVLAVIHRIGAKIIGVTSNPDSSMTKMCNIVLYTGNTEEACPLNLAPTCSTTVCLVLGDALAIALMKMRDFGIDEFAFRHPGGRIGKRLLLKVADVMLGGDRNPVIPVTSTVQELLITITEKQAGAVSVTDEHGKLIGLVTDFDIRLCLQSGENPLTMSIENLMNPNPMTVKNDEKAYSALCLMQGRSKPITVLPVLDAQELPVGMLRLQDLVAAGI